MAEIQFQKRVHKQYINGKIDLGTIVEFLVYVNMLTWPVAIVGWVTSMIQQAEASQKRINEFLNQQPEIENPSLEPIKLEGKISFTNVHFTYPDTGITALKGVSFCLKPGEKLAILGKTGAGKSSPVGPLSDTLQDVSILPPFPTSLV